MYSVLNTTTVGEMKGTALVLKASNLTECQINNYRKLPLFVEGFPFTFFAFAEDENGEVSGFRYTLDPYYTGEKKPAFAEVLIIYDWQYLEEQRA